MRGFVLQEKGHAAWTEVPVPPLGPVRHQEENDDGDPVEAAVHEGPGRVVHR